MKEPNYPNEAEILDMERHQVTPAKQPEQTVAPKSEPRTKGKKAEALTEGSLVQRLAQACDEVGGVEKTGRNTAQGYNYVKAADVAMALRHKLFSRGIVIIPDEVECSTKQIQFQNAKGEQRNANEVVVRTAYVITDGAETLTMHGYGIAWDSGDKAVYKAKTGSLKYFLRGLGLIPDENEPEADESIDRAMKGKSDETSEEFDQRTEGQQCIAVFQQNAIIEACKRTGKTEEETSAYLGLIGHKRIEHLFKSEFNDFLKWANSKGKPVASNPAKVQPKGPSPADQNRITANKKLWASAAEHSVSEADVKQYAYETYKVQSMTELTAAQLAEVTSWVEGV